MAKKLSIDYDNNIKLGVVSDDASNFFVLNKLFSDFQVVTEEKQPWLDEVNIVNTALNLQTKQSGNISTVLRSKKFVELTKTDLKRKYVLYSPLDPPYKVNPLTYLMNSPTIAHAYENKRYFRDEFADLIRMPEYEIKHMNELDRAASYRELKEEFGSFVMQDEESSGSKGTYMIHDNDDYTDAVRALKKFSQGRSVVVSRYVKGQTSSIQVCITRHGIFSGGIQRQLIDSPVLCNPKLEGATKWCGGELGGTYPDIVQHKAQEMATIVGSELASHGYKGIFGIDVIVTPENEVYAIEINARLTGYSQTLSDMQLKEGKIPFMLLHVLELGNFKYEVTDLDALPSNGRFKKPVTFMIVNNPLLDDIVIKREIKPAVYQYTKNGTIEFVKYDTSLQALKNEDMILISSRHAKGDTVKSGKRILKITKLGKGMKNSELTIKSHTIARAVKQHFDLP